MRRIYIDEKLDNLARKYAKDPFYGRTKLVKPDMMLQNLSTDLQANHPSYSKYVEKIIDNYEAFNALKPSEIQNVKNEFDKIVPENDLNTQILEKDNKEFYKLVVESMRYDALRGIDFLPYLKEMKINSCVYCNAQLTVVAEVDMATKELSAKLELDHHYAKSIYPFLCTSFFNLYPVCSSCNKAKSQNNTEFKLYSENENDLDVFEFTIDNDSFLTYINSREMNDLKINFGSKPEIVDISSEHDKMFCIQGIYNTQKDIVEELILKKEKYTEIYKEDLIDTFTKLFPDKAIINRLIVGNYVTPEEIHKRPMSKFMQDIWRDLNKS